MFKLKGSNKTAYDKGVQDAKNGKTKEDDPYTFVKNKMLSCYWLKGFNSK